MTYVTMRQTLIFARFGRNSASDGQFFEALSRKLRQILWRVELRFRLALRLINRPLHARKPTRGSHVSILIFLSCGWSPNQDHVVNDLYQADCRTFQSISFMLPFFEDVSLSQICTHSLFSRSALPWSSCNSFRYRCRSLQRCGSGRAHRHTPHVLQKRPAYPPTALPGLSPRR